ncbi:MAG: exopolyphosphatase [Acidimicrobiales bacterium]
MSGVNIAAVDCGTLSTRLLVCAPDGEALVRLAHITRLGDGVDASGHLRPDAVERALAALREYRRVMDRLHVGRARMVGTSALRDSANRDAFSVPASTVIGTEMELLSGQDEAALSFIGATAALDEAKAPWLVVDIGGGSTELALGALAGKAPELTLSLNLGCVRVTERFLRDDPPGRAELAEASRWLHDQFRQAQSALPSLGKAVSLVGLAGTVSALACYAQGLASYERELVHHYRLERSSVGAALYDLAGQPAARRGQGQGIEPGRAATIVGGALVLATLMSHFGFEECLVSEADILNGLVMSIRAAPQGLFYRAGRSCKPAPASS